MRGLGEHEAQVVLASFDILGESPIWSELEQALYWVDIRRRRLNRWSPAAGARRSWSTPGLCCGVAMGRDGLVLAIDRALMSFDPAIGAFRTLAVVEADRPLNRLNELKCDPIGRIWCGSMRDFAVETSGSLYRFEEDWTATRMLSDVRIPNALDWSPDGERMYFADSAEGSVRGYRYDLAAGTISSEFTLVPSARLPGRPDGCAVDAEGGLWIACSGGGCVVRLTDQGEMSEVIRLPGGAEPTACAFGGEHLDILFISSRRQGVLEAELTDSAGALFAFRSRRPGVRRQHPSVHSPV